ncbi:MULTISPECIES: hypothetical protein [Sphingomonas]|uniref:hypothetical protein n=1 Tax=Sphingomonas TaxID=13687 RepID=UPI0013B44816|nr:MULTISPECIES: hypothetical protein [Sphingomonas]
MAKLHDDWTVLPHDPLQEVAPGLLTVVGQIPMPLGNFPRRMTVVALSGDHTAIFSPICLPEAEMARIEALGQPAFLIVPNPAHRLDLRPFHRRYPKAAIVAPEGARAKVAEAVPVTTTTADLGTGRTLITVPGLDAIEFVLRVDDAGETSLVTNDIIGHVRSPRGVGAWIMARLMGFGPASQVPRVARRMFVKDAPALAAQFELWAALPDLRRIIPSHGDIIERPAPVLRTLARSLTQ